MTIDTQTQELAQQVIDILNYQNGSLMKPMIAVVQPDVGNSLDCGFMVVYASETKFNIDMKQIIPLAPFFFPHAVARHLVETKVIVEVTETRRTGISVIWCEQVHPQGGKNG